MSKLDERKDYNIGSISLSSSSLIYINGNIEQIPSQKGWFYFKEAVYLNAKTVIKAGGYEESGIRVLLNVNELKALSYAIKELIKMPSIDNNKKSEFEKISNSGVMKKIYLGFLAPNNYYINVKIFDKDSPRTISLKSDKYRLLAFADSMLILAQEIEKSMFAFQRKKDKIIKTLDNKSEKRIKNEYV